jgi:hypothetical protein
MSVRIVSSKQVFPPEDEEEGEILYNLRIDVGCDSQPRVNREMHLPQGRDRPSILEAGGKPGPLRTQLNHPWEQVVMASASKGLLRHRYHYQAYVGYWLAQNGKG